MTDHIVSHPVARKFHRCVECRRTIRLGETYCRTATFGDGPPYVTAECAHCEAAWDWVWHHNEELRWRENELSEGGLSIWLLEEDDVPLRIQAAYRSCWTINGKIFPVDHRLYGLVEPARAAS